MRTADPRTLIGRFDRLKTLVVGDLMLDHFVWGSVSRISPEAPVPVVEVSRETEVPGGAGNVAVNMAALGSEVSVVGLVGADTGADRLLSKFQDRGIRTGCIVRSDERPTIVKTRVIAQHQQVVRFDREVKGEISQHLRSKLVAEIRRVLPETHAVVFSDYAKGVLSGPLVKIVIDEARRHGIPVTVDPKPENFRHYRRATMVTPNLQEALESGGVRRLEDETHLDRLGHALLKKIQADSVLITRGEKGMSLFERGKKPFHIPTRAREVFDVTGAGDTVIGTLTLALAAGSDLKTAAELANYAAGIVVGKIGTASVSGQELLKTVGKNHG